MHGLIFVTWEKYLAERFGTPFLNTYRATIGEIPATAPLYSRVYSDETLLAGVGAATRLSRVPVDTLLREYGRYFIINGLTRHLCKYLLNGVHDAQELLLTMSEAHKQMQRTPDAITPPLFKYETNASNPRWLALIYDSPRQLCPVLLGTIEGAGERYSERVQVSERSCMKQGAPVCRFEMLFSPRVSALPEASVTLPQKVQEQARQQLTNTILAILPDRDGVTLPELQNTLRHMQFQPEQLRLSQVLNALAQLRFAGLIATSSNEPGDTTGNRRYWRAPTRG